MPEMDHNTLSLFAGIGALLLLASVIGRLLMARRPGATRGDRQPQRPHQRLVGDGAGDRHRLLFGKYGVIVLFYGVSFYALREFMTLTPTRRSDYPALVAAFYVALPVQYVLIAMDWYGLFSIFIPVYLFLLLPILASFGGDTTRFSNVRRRCSGA